MRRIGSGKRTRWAAGCGLMFAFGWVIATGSGCSFIKAAALMVAPTEQKVAPEYKDLPGKRVLIYVWAERSILWEYTKLRLDLSGWMSSYLEQNVKEVTLVSPIEVERYIEKQRTPDLDPVALGREFKAQVVIHLSVYQFSLRDPEMAHYYRGRVGASVNVFDLTEQDPSERITLRDAKVVVPEKDPIGLNNATAAQVRQATYDAFTIEVGKKFHEWQRPVN